MSFFDSDLKFQNHILLLPAPDSHLSQFHAAQMILPHSLKLVLQLQNQRNWYNLTWVKYIFLLCAMVWGHLTGDRTEVACWYKKVGHLGYMDMLCHTQACKFIECVD